MRAELLWSPKAREDLLDIYLTIGLDNPAAAERLYRKIEDKTERLRVYPRLGVRRAAIAASARILIEGAYLIIYGTNPDKEEGPVDAVEIVRVVDRRRDLKRPF